MADRTERELNAARLQGVDDQRMYGRTSLGERIARRVVSRVKDRERLDAMDRHLQQRASALLAEHQKRPRAKPLSELADAFRRGNPKAQRLALEIDHALQGRTEAASNIGRLVLRGGALQTASPDEGIELLRLASAEGNLDAVLTLAWCYERGQWVEPDLKLAAQLFRTAASLGFESGTEIADLLEDELGERDSPVGTSRPTAPAGDVGAEPMTSGDRPRRDAEAAALARRRSEERRRLQAAFEREQAAAAKGLQGTWTCTNAQSGMPDGPPWTIQPVRGDTNTYQYTVARDAGRLVRMADVNGLECYRLEGGSFGMMVNQYAQLGFACTVCFCRVERDGAVIAVFINGQQLPTHTMARTDLGVRRARGT